MKFYLKKDGQPVKQSQSAQIDADILQTITANNLRGLALLQEISKHHKVRSPNGSLSLCFAIRNDDYDTAKRLNIDISAVVKRGLTAAIAAEKAISRTENAAEECEA